MKEADKEALIKHLKQQLLVIAEQVIHKKKQIKAIQEWLEELEDGDQSTTEGR